MIPINNSDLAWLVVSDYNQDNGILGAEELREDIYCPAINEDDFNGGKSIGGYEYGHYNSPGFMFDWSFYVGANYSNLTATPASMSQYVGGTFACSECVGGNFQN